MNSRDPFDLRGKPLSFTQTGIRITTQSATALSRQAVVSGKQAIDAGKHAAQAGAAKPPKGMSFNIPSNVPSFTNPQRRHEDLRWSGGGGGGGGVNERRPGLSNGVGDKIGHYLDKTELPMYKDKPYSYAASRRRRNFWRRKRVLGPILCVLMLFLYWLGLFSGSSDTPGKTAKETTKTWKDWIKKGGQEKIDWEARRERVKQAFTVSWDSYERHAWGYDVYHPITNTGRQMAPKGLGWIIVDSLDSLILMNLTSQLIHAREWISTTLDYDQDQDVNTFETTIRMLGGLLSAHYLSTTYPDMAPLTDDNEGAPGEDLYVEKASDLANRLLGAYDSDSGVPFASVNLQKSSGIPSHDDGGASSTAEATSLQLEMKYLAKLTGEKNYWDKVEKVMQVIDDNGAQDGLLPIFVYTQSGNFRENNIRLGSRGDSYYEYLIKQYLQTSRQEPIYLEMWDQALAGVRKNLITYSKPSNLTVLGERPNGLGEDLSPKMDHLVCFMPGTIALGATGGLSLAEAKKSGSWGPKQEEEMKLARELMQTCFGMYKVTATGLAPEIAHFNLYDPPLMEKDNVDPLAALSDEEDADWRSDYVIKSSDEHNLQRPETVESLFYMWRITGDEMYRKWGWEIFKSFVQHTMVQGGGGFTSLSSVQTLPVKQSDNMESFWLAETLKYLYLLFSPDDLLPLDGIVINTEAHIFPRFELGKLFSTGWKRKPRSKDGNVISTNKEQGQENVVPIKNEDRKIGDKDPAIAGR
ncbi:MAG: mannosyl-oligosaccharide alpha-1,2-mannosidase [Sclerophora amabilis]|nr:MAG: mannosyl-oligosaccharide alpha-1,2-mannosidase [Sclerophora amabilis]